MNEQFPFWYGKDLIFDHGLIDEETSHLGQEKNEEGFEEWLREMAEKTG